MSDINNSDNEIIQQLLHQLNIARSEIHNLRQQVKSSNHQNQKDYENIRNILSDYQCPDCLNRQSQLASASGRLSIEEHPEDNENGTLFPYIGKVYTHFPEKRGTPRQPGICFESTAKLVLNNDVFTNPDHALTGLEEYSHIWILFHFHKNESVHVRAKVAPPRLNGLRTGVFSTRSPHRPSPIGLSLVKIEHIEEHTIYFSGVDMIDQTPVLDIKPYIPQYDNPAISLPNTDPEFARFMVGEENVSSTAAQARENTSSSSTADDSFNRSVSRMGEREAPDGEEEESDRSNWQPSGAAGNPHNTMVDTPEGHIRVPAWINQPSVSTLTVTFNERALAQLQELAALEAEERRITITNVLREDPRSVYLRERWGNQYYLFRIADLHVSCKFDDTTHSVNVFQIRDAQTIIDN